MSAQRLADAELRPVWSGGPPKPERPRHESVLVEVTPEGVIVCGWLALCEEPAAGVVFVPATSDYYPACSSCAQRFGLEVIPASFEVVTD